MARFITMIKFAIVCVLVLGLTLEQCDKGCLKCNSKNECIFCDVSNSYYLSGTKCAIATLTNCATLLLSGDCAQCSASYSLDSSTKKCIAVDTTKIVANCALYGSAQVCTACSKGFLISNGKCTAVSITIANCDSYSADGVCSACASGYIFNVTRKSCIQSPSTTQCNAYSFLDCKSCLSGYIPNKNLYFAGYTSNSNLLWADMPTLTGQASDWINTPRCQKYQDANCLVGSAFNVCTTCKPGHFITSTFGCRAFPKPIIEGCAIYSTLTTCAGCQSGFYLQTNIQCTLITGNAVISDCLNYSTTSALVQCIQCATNKFLIANTCTANNRVDSLNMANCKTTSINADTCSACNDGFSLTTDGKKCLTAVTNCATYANSNSASTSLTCTKCNDTFYLNTDANSVTTCVAGGIEGCVTYSSNTVCVACNTAAYYLNNSLCVKHVTVANCINYSGSQFNKCVACAQGFFPFTYSNSCAAITAIANCVAYTNETTCSTCNTGYFLLNNACISVSTTFTNCVAAGNAATQCSQCSDTYALNTGVTPGVCAQNHRYILDQCDSPVTGVAVTLKSILVADTGSCVTCKENSYPIALEDLYSCIDNNLLASKGVTGSVIVSGCAKYGIMASATICTQCATGFLNIDVAGVRTCSGTCAAATNTIVPDNLDGQYNLCVLQSNATYGAANCGMSTRYWNPSGSLGYQCVKTGAQTLIAALTTNLADNPSMWRDIDGSSVPRPSGAFFYNGIPTSLITTPATFAHDNQNDTAKNCELYYNKSGNLACARCAWGYTSTYVTAGTLNKTQCSAITLCDKTVSYTGFSNKLNMLLSCHACSLGNFVLVSASIASEVTNFTFADLTNDIPVIQCVTPTANVAQPNVPMTVPNCLIYGWFKISGADPVNAKGCLACQPGYNLSGNFGSCDPIANCDNTKKFMANRCSACTQSDATGAVEWKAFQDYNAQACLLVKSANCLFVTGIADPNGKYTCGLCKPGYILNQDKLCEQITLPQCNDAAGATNLYPIATINSISSAATYYAYKFLSGAATVAGCNSCASGFSGVRLPTSEVQCAVSPYVQANVYQAGTKYIPDCTKYSKTLTPVNSISAVCMVCKNNKIPTDDRTKCVFTIQNCLRADNLVSTKCSVCAATHVQINGVCTLKNIVNCTGYNEAVNVADLLCITCADGFVLATNQKSCYAGYLTGCKVYNTDLPFVCLQCLPNYNLVNTSNNRSYCIKIDQSSNCLNLDVSQPTGLQGGVYRCTSCSITSSAAFLPKAYLTADATLVQSVCLSLNLVDKCTAYDTSNTNSVQANSLLCTACSTGFWIDQSKNVCTARVNSPSACTTFYTAADKCSVCAAGTFKSADETDCIANPNGILRCATYSNDTTCIGCNAPAYLSNNTCPLSNVIGNCAAYKANNTCTACANGFFLTNSTACTQAVATNCLTYSAINSCANCPPGMGLKNDTNGNVNCVSYGIANCVVATSVFPFTCSVCAAGYYLAADGTCVLPTTIRKCVNYDSATTCTQCDSTAVLTLDRKTCNDTTFAGVSDSNCADNQEVSTPICSKCSAGSYFFNGTCFACSNNTWNSGCFSCDPANQTNCLTCRSGYYQNANGSCISNTPVNNTNNTNSTSAVIMKIFGLLVALFAFLF